MIGAFQVWHKGEDRPATNIEIYSLDEQNAFTLSYSLENNNGLIGIELSEQCDDFEIRKVDKE